VPAVDPTKGSDDQLTERLAKLGETDTDNAQRFAERFGTKVIHTPGRGWLVFDGKRCCCASSNWPRRPPG
jgi:hypothetical protein